MKLQQARKEVLIKLATRCGFEIPEQRLSGETLSAIGSLAAIYRHLVALADTLHVERALDARLSSRIKRDVSGRENKELKIASTMFLSIQEDFQRNLAELASRIVSELRSEPVGFPQTTSSFAGGSTCSRINLEALRCPTCGAPLGPPTSRIIRCNYCMSVYETSDYLGRLSASLNFSANRPSAAGQTPTNGP